MSNDFGAKVISWLGVTGFPTLNVNLIPGETVSYTSNGNVGEQNAGMIREVVEQYTAQDAKSAIAAVVRADKASSTVSVEAKIKIAESGSYRVAAWLLEDGISDNSQQNYTDLTDDFLHTTMYCVSQAHRLPSVTSWAIHCRLVLPKILHAVSRCHRKRWITAVC